MFKNENIYIIKFKVVTDILKLHLQGRFESSVEMKKCLNHQN